MFFQKSCLVLLLSIGFWFQASSVDAQNVEVIKLNGVTYANSLQAAHQAIEQVIESQYLTPLEEAGFTFTYFYDYKIVSIEPSPSGRNKYTFEGALVIWFGGGFVNNDGAVDGGGLVDPGERDSLTAGPPRFARWSTRAALNNFQSAV